MGTERGPPMTFSCADALSEVESDYKSMPLKTRSGKDVQLRNLLLLSDEGMQSALTLLGAFGDSKATSVDGLAQLMPKMRDLLLLLADKPADMRKEVADWPLGMYMKVISEWQDVTEMGEAQPSDD